MAGKKTKKVPLKKRGRPASGKRVTAKNITLEEVDLLALEDLATIAQRTHIMWYGKQNPNIGTSWVIRALIRNANSAFADFKVGEDHPAPGYFFGISGDITEPAPGD